MILPITFKNTPYRVAGSAKYTGDLILMPEVIYYFPHTDVANKRFLVVAIVLFIVLSPLLAAVSAYLLLVFGFLFVLLLVAVGISIPNLIREMLLSGITSGIERAWELHKESQERPHYTPEANHEQQQPETVDLSPLLNPYPIILYPTLWYSLILDSALLAMKENRSVSRHSLPAPIRFSKGDIQDISVSSMGLLRIKTEFDMEHKFYVGILRKDMLKMSLMEGGFISQFDAPNNSFNRSAS